MKRIVCLGVAAVLIALVASACAQAYVPGTYEVTTRGMGGKITFEITFSETEITAIEPVKHHETEGLGDRALENVIPAILEAQSTDVDAWSGATITSDAIKAAVQEAMEMASVQSAPVDEAEEIEETAETPQDAA